MKFPARLDPDVAIDAEPDDAHRTAPSAKERLVGRLWAGALSVLARTWRVERRGMERLDAVEASGDRVLVAAWHGEYRPFLVLTPDRPVWTLSTDDERGRIVDVASEALGHHCIRRPADLRGEAAERFAIRAFAAAPRVAIVADGPAGPAREVKDDLVKIASVLGLRLVPAASAVRPAWERNRWDRQKIALPFARVVTQIGVPLPPAPRDLDEAGVATWRVRLAGAIDAASAEAHAALAKDRGGSSGHAQNVCPNVK